MDPLKNVGGFAFREARGGRKRAAADDVAPPPSKRASTGRRKSSGTGSSEEASGAAPGHVAVDEAGGTLRAEALSAYTSSASLPADQRIAAVLNAVFTAAEAHAGGTDGGAAAALHAVHADFLKHLTSEMTKELSRLNSAASKNPKNVANARAKAEGERRIQEYETELAHWTSLSTKFTTSSSSTPGALSPSAVQDWAASKGKHGSKLMTTVEGATDKALQNLDSVASAMRNGSRTLARAGRAVAAASKETRAATVEAVGGKRGAEDPRAILRSMTR